MATRMMRQPPSVARSGDVLLTTGPHWKSIVDAKIGALDARAARGVKADSILWLAVSWTSRVIVRVPCRNTEATGTIGMSNTVGSVHVYNQSIIL